MKNRILFQDLFVGHRVYSATPASNAGHNLVLTDTSSAGSPTVLPVTPGRGVALDLAATSEVENLCLSFGDNLSFDIDDLVEVIIDVKMNQAELTSGSQFAIGLTGDRNDAIDSIAQAALFRVIGADSTTAVVVETDDGTVDKNDVATGQTLINVSKQLRINFATGKSDVRFFIDGQPVATNTTFDMSNYSGGLQFFAQLQKAANTNADGVTIERVEVRGRG